MNAGVNILKQYFKITYRNILKHKAQSFIAIFGLSLSLTCLIPALCWMYYETSYDLFYPYARNIYRIYSVDKHSGKVNERVPGLLGKELLKQFPNIETSTSFIPEKLDYKAESSTYVQLNTICVDSSFCQVFPQRIVSGDMQQALQLAGNMILTESVALRLFGSAEKALGKKLENSLSRIFGSCTVTAVVKDPPLDTNLPFDAIVNFPALQDASMIMPETEQWNYYNDYIYVKLHSQTNINELTRQLHNFSSQLKTNSDIELKILPINDVRHQLNTNLPFTLNFISLIILAGLLLIFSSLFNFLNLYLTNFYRRINEFRQRMIFGATKKQIISQIICEITCAILLALSFCCILISFTLPAFSKLLGIKMPISLLLHFFIVCGLVLTALILFISFILCWRLSQSVIQNLSKKRMPKHAIFQRIVVVSQLVVSIIFIVSASVMMLQMNFVNRKNLGFNNNGLIQLYSTNLKLSKYQTALKQQFETIPQITNISTTSFEPRQNADMQYMTSRVEWTDKQPLERPVFQLFFTDDKFPNTFKLNVIMGKWWNENENNSRKIVLNEEAVRIMGLSNPVGTIIRMDPLLISSDGTAPLQEYEIVGVVNDFHSLSLRSPIYPAIFRPGSGNIWYIRVMPGQEQEVIQKISTVLPKIDVTLTSIQLTLLDELYDHLNYSEQIGLKLFSVLAVVCLLISLFGIYAITAEATQRRRKEIAIRKIVGGEVNNIILMFFHEYTTLTIVSSAIALPLAYYMMTCWLQSYAFRINIPLWLLITILLAVLIIVLSTILRQILKAANANPSRVIKMNE